MLKRKPKPQSDGSKHWYEDKYQSVLVQRNMLALATMAALLVAFGSVLAVAWLAPLKSVEPYLIQIEEKTGITQKVEPLSRNQVIAAGPAVDRYFVATYLRAREGYNPTLRLYNDMVVRVLSSRPVFYAYRNSIDPANKESVVNRLGTTGQRLVKIHTMNYITNPMQLSITQKETPDIIMQARITTTDVMPNAGDLVQRWIVTITFNYADLTLSETDRLLNPLNFQVVNYQVEREIN